MSNRQYVALTGRTQQLLVNGTPCSSANNRINGHKIILNFMCGAADFDITLPTKQFTQRFISDGYLYDEQTNSLQKNYRAFSFCVKHERAKGELGPSTQ